MKALSKMDSKEPVEIVHLNQETVKMEGTKATP